MTWLGSVWPPFLIMGCVWLHPAESSSGAGMFKTAPKSRDGSFRAYENLILKVIQRGFHCILLVKMSHKASSDSKGKGHQLPMVKGVRLGEKLVDLLLIISYSLPPGYKIPHLSCVQNALRVSQDPQSLMQSWTETPSPKSHHLKRPRCRLSFLGVIPWLKLLRCNSYGSRGRWTK